MIKNRISKIYPRLLFIISFIIFSIILNPSIPQKLYTNVGVGYLFRLKRVELKYYPTAQTVKRRNIAFQSVVTETKKIFQEDNIATELMATDYINNVKFEINEDQQISESFNYNLFKITADIDNYKNDNDTQFITIDLIEPIEFPKFTRACEFWVSTNYAPIKVKFYFIGNNRGGAKILEFSQEILLNRLNTLYLESFNILADSTSPTIGELALTKVDIILPSANTKERELNFSISTTFNNLNIKKNIGTENILKKRKYIDFEDSDKIRDNWKIRYGDNPISIYELGDFINHTSKIDNGEELYFQFNEDRLTEFNYILIDFQEDFKIPIDNILTILVNGRNSYEELSFIFEDARGIYYELSAGFIDFNGWRAIELTIPTNPQNAYRTKESYYTIEHSNLLGMKIRPGFDGRIGIGFDNISSIIK